MNYRLNVVPPEGRKVTIIVLMIITALIMVVLNFTGRDLITKAAPAGILSYELAGNEDTAQEILDSWDETARSYAGFNLGFDYLFLIFYSTTIALSSLWVSDLLKLRRNLKRLAAILAFSLFIAALLDVIENAALLKMLVAGVASPWPQISFVCAIIKFGLVFLGSTFVIVGSVYYLWHSRRNP